MKFYACDVNPEVVSTEAEDELCTECRPVVVIDPEDREAIERMADAFCYSRWDHTGGGDECDPLTFSSMQAALREFANPKPPKPDEPQGLGAVVEGADGVQWVRIGDTGCDDWRKAGLSGGSQGQWYRYDDFAAVKVLSEGVPD